MATAALGHAALDNGPLGQHGGETLVEQLDAHPGQLLPETLDQRAYLRIARRRSPAHLPGHAHDDQIDALGDHIAFHVIEQRSSRHRIERPGNDPQRVGHRQSRPLRPVVDRQNPPHNFLAAFPAFARKVKKKTYLCICVARTP